MAHLRKLPTYFTKGEERRGVFFTIQARELIADGWVEEDEKAERIRPQKLPEVAVEVGGSAFDMENKLEEASEVLEEMTKSELLDWAEKRNIEVKSSAPKYEILKSCKEVKEAS